MEKEGSLPCASLNDVCATHSQAPLSAATIPQRNQLGDWLGSRLRVAVRAKLRKIHRGSLRVSEGGDSLWLGDRSSSISAAIEVHRPALYTSLALGGSLAAAESYIDGDWDSPDLVSLLRLMIANGDVLESLDRIGRFLTRPLAAVLQRMHHNSREGSRRNIAAHYDLGNDFFELILDPTMTYSCGLFPSESSSMQEASLAKYDRICRLLRLRPCDRVVEIGTGWGGFAMFAAKNYGCHVTTTTISSAQHAWARRMIDSEGLTDRISLRQDDYRDLTGRFDKLVSIEMIEAVGHRYLGTFFEKCGALLKPDGQMMLQAITIADQKYEAYRRNVDFIQKHIFPGGCLPSISAMLGAIRDRTDLQLVSFDDFADHYVRTLQQWRKSMRAAEPAIRDLGKTEAFLRAWEYYFAYCEAGFAERQIGVCQLHLVKSASRVQPAWQLSELATT